MIPTISLTVWIFALACCVFFIDRNQKVYRFRMELIDLCYRYDIWAFYHLPDFDVKSNTFSDVTSYYDMVMSFKALTFENWLTWDTLEKIRFIQELKTKTHDTTKH